MLRRIQKVPGALMKLQKLDNLRSMGKYVSQCRSTIIYTATTEKAIKAPKSEVTFVLSQLYRKLSLDCK